MDNASLQTNVCFYGRGGGDGRTSAGQLTFNWTVGAGVPGFFPPAEKAHIHQLLFPETSAFFFFIFIFLFGTFF